MVALDHSSVSIREDAEPKQRARLIRLLTKLDLRIQCVGYRTGVGFSLSDLTTEALERAAEAEVRRFWFSRRHVRENRLAYRRAA